MGALAPGAQGHRYLLKFTELYTYVLNVLYVITTQLKKRIHSLNNYLQNAFCVPDLRPRGWGLAVNRMQPPLKKE